MSNSATATYGAPVSNTLKLFCQPGDVYGQGKQYVGIEGGDTLAIYVAVSLAIAALSRLGRVTSQKSLSRETHILCAA